MFMKGRSPQRGCHVDKCRSFLATTSFCVLRNRFCGSMMSSQLLHVRLSFYTVVVFTYFCCEGDIFRVGIYLLGRLLSSSESIACSIVDFF